MARRSRLVPGLLIAVTLVLAAIFFGLPLAIVFYQAFRLGAGAYAAAILEPGTLHAIWLTAITAIVVVPINVLFGLSAAWLIARFNFPAKKLLQTVIELPFSISPIVAGTIYLFLYGAQGLLGPTLADYDIRLMFNVPAIMLASLFVTAPFVFREVLPLMQIQGKDGEEAARTLGASSFKMFLRVTLPNIRWALFYGAVLCNARVMGEFGAVSVVSGTVRGRTNTLPLQIQLLFNDFSALGAFAAATILAAVAIVTLFIKFGLEIFQPDARYRPGARH